MNIQNIINTNSRENKSIFNNIRSICYYFINFKNIPPLLISIVCIVISFRIVDINDVYIKLNNINLNYIFISIFMFSLYIFIEIIRFKIILHKFGSPVSLRLLLIASSIKNLIHRFSINSIDTSKNQANFLRYFGVPFNKTITTIIISNIIKIALVLIMLVFFIRLWIFLDVSGFQYLHYNYALQNIQRYLTYITTGLFAFGVVIFIFLSNIRLEIIQFIKKTINTIPRYWFVLLITIVGNISILGSYISILYSIGFEIDFEPQNFDAIVALMIIIFTTILPLSISGFGVRELTSVVILDAVGIDPSLGLSSALILSSIAFSISFILRIYGLKFLYDKKNISLKKTPINQWNYIKYKWLSLIIGIFSVFITLLIFVQFKMSIPYIRITINIADVISIMSCFLFIIIFFQNFTSSPKLVSIGIIIISCIIFYGFVLGYIRFESNTWGIYNRGFGWIVILGYIAIPFIFVNFYGNNGRNLLLIFIVISGVMLVMIEFFSAFIISDLEADKSIRKAGFSGNAGAFSFQMIITSIAALVIYYQKRNFRRLIVFLSVLITTGGMIYFTGSRGGIVMFLLLIIIIFMIYSIEFIEKISKNYIHFTLICILYTTTILVISYYAIDILLRESYRTYSSIIISDRDRYDITMFAIMLFLENPFFGNGLGGFIERRDILDIRYRIIHSTPLWLMVEMGLVGFFATLFVFMTFFIRSCIKMNKYMKNNDFLNASFNFGIISLLACAGVGNIVYDYFYQRPFWFLLALLSANTFLPKFKKSRNTR